jgi:DNA-binding response OmpR family regulator
MQARCLAAGASAYLRKPLEAGALLSAIEAAIDPAPETLKAPGAAIRGAPDASNKDIGPRSNCGLRHNQ